MPRRGNGWRSQKRALNQKPSSNQGSSDQGSSNNIPSDNRVEDHQSTSPTSASREALLDRATQSSGPDTLDGGSPMPSRPPSPLHNHDKMDSGPHYFLKIMVYETTHKVRWLLPARLWTENVKHIMEDDLDLTVIKILDHISSAVFTGSRLNSVGLTREEARAFQKGFMRYMDWQGLTIEREIHPLTLKEGTAEVNHYHQEIHGNHMPFKLPMGLCEFPATCMTCCQSLLRPSSCEKSMSISPRDKNNSASTWQIYRPTSPQRRRCQHTYRSPGGDPDPSNSKWDSASTASGISSISRRQRWEGTCDPKTDRKIFLSKLMDNSTKEACWMWRADALDLIEKCCSEETIEVEIRKSLASCSRDLWFREKCLLGHSILWTLNDMKRSSPSEVAIQCDALPRAFYGLSQKKGEPIGTYSMCLDSAANKVSIRFPEWLGDSDAAIKELIQDRFLKSIDNEIRMWIAHWINRVQLTDDLDIMGL